MRLHRFIGQCGVTSRRKAEEMIAEGRVTVNGDLVTTPGTSVADGDLVCVDGQRIELPKKAYYVLNKPTGFVTTLSDPSRRRTVSDLFPPSVVGLKPIGRLDVMTSGLLLLTNDGEFASKVGHPSGQVEKEYVAKVRREPTERDLSRLVRGVFEGGERLRAVSAKLTGRATDQRPATIRIVLHEGKNRQVRRMLSVVGCPVLQLERVRFGPVRLKGMRPGECRKLGMEEIKALLRSMEKPK
ncbi:MAG: pseudouridine synthase [Fimbriimonadaceae bacterium]